MSKKQGQLIGIALQIKDELAAGRMQRTSTSTHELFSYKGEKTRQFAKRRVTDETAAKLLNIPVGGDIQFPKTLLAPRPVVEKVRHYVTVKRAVKKEKIPLPQMLIPLPLAIPYAHMFATDARLHLMKLQHYLFKSNTWQSTVADALLTPQVIASTTPMFWASLLLDLRRSGRRRLPQRIWLEQALEARFPGWTDFDPAAYLARRRRTPPVSPYDLNPT